ncbi:MAG: hypothetical protein GY803_16420, partial [Chloroflexi bacterium]|nr:hypothetical protein [Chloroflexota bacterium]
ITVTLFEDFDGDGVADGPTIATAETDAAGFYQFSGLEVALVGDPNNTTNYIVQVDVNDADLGVCNVPAPPTEYNPPLDSGNPDDPHNDFSFTEANPDILIDKKVMVPGTNPPEFTDDLVQFAIGAEVTFGYFVTNPGNLPLSGVEVVDDNATPDDVSDDVSFTINSPEFVGGDDGNGLLDPGEVWQFEFTKIAAFISDTPGNGKVPVPASEMGKYLLIGTTNNEFAKAVNVQNGDLGADVIVLSTEIDDNVDFDNDDVFLNNAGSVWIDYDNQPNTQPDYLPGAAQVSEGVTWTGDVALTSPRGKFDLSNVELYGQVGVVADHRRPVSSVSNSLFFPDGVGDGIDPSAGLDLPPNGLVSNADAEMARLRSELDAFEDFVTELLPEVTLSPWNGLPTSDGIEDVDIFTLTIDPADDANDDGIVVYDIDMGDNDFKITNSNWIIDGDGSKFAIFRILGDSNLVLNQSTIVLGDSGIAKDGELGAIFVKAAEFRNGQGGYYRGESNSGDTTLSFNDTVLNGVGFYDLIVFDENISNGNFDNGITELKINNGQGCSHFISPKINFNNVRFDRCAFGSFEEQTNVAQVTGISDVREVNAEDSATIKVWFIKLSNEFWP